MSAPSAQSDLQSDNWKNVASAGQQQRPTSLSDANVGSFQFREARSNRWVPIVDYEDRYEVSNDGAVRNIKTGRELSQFKTSGGYLIVKLFKGVFGKNFKVHRLVAAAFIPNPEAKEYVNHKDLHKTNNTVQNLEWCTPSENVAHYLNAVGGAKCFAGSNEILPRSDTGAGSKPPASPAPVALPLTLRVYEKRIPNRVMLGSAPVREGAQWHTVSLPYVSILGDTETVIGEVYA